MNKNYKIYEGLAHAIIMQAVSDYRKARKLLADNPDDETALKIIEDCEDFFLSEWFECLTALDGGQLLDRLEKETAA